MIVRVDHTGTLVKPVEQVTVLKLATSGPQGLTGTTLTGRGAWTAGAYAKDEFVSYGGASYVANTATTSGDTPGVSSKWTLLASKGDTGATGSGATGAQGSSGVVSVNAPITNSGTSTAANLSLSTNVASGVPTLDSSGLIQTSQLPALAITDTSVVASEAAMLALSAQVGDVAVRSDLSKSYILKATPASTLANWQELLSPPSAVLSVAGRTGAISLANTDISGLGTASTKDVPATGNASSSQVVYGTDTRLTDTRTPTDDSVTSAKIVDGTIVNADVNASAGIVDTKLNLSAATTSGVTPSSSAKIVSASTTVSGTAISSANKVADANAYGANFLGQAGIIIPQFSTTRSSGSFSADYQYRGNRFYLPGSITVMRIAYNCTSAATVSGGAGDTGATVDIAIYNSSNTKVFSTGPISNTAYVAGTTTGISSGTSAFGTTGTKVISLASSWSLSASTIYYLVMHYGVMSASGTRASVTMHGNSANSLFGTTVGTSEVVSGTGTTTTAPSTITTSDGSSTPVIALRTD